MTANAQTSRRDFLTQSAKAAAMAGLININRSYAEPRKSGANKMASTKLTSSIYVQMTPQPLAEAIEKNPVAYIPVGIAEWHGEQSACGLDALKAETLCEMAAQILGGVCFPTLWVAPDVSTPFDPTKYPRGTLTINKQVYYTAAEQLLTQIEAMGFKVAFYMSGHYPSVIPPVVEKFNKHHKMKVLNFSENQVVEGMPAGDHAGAWETALLRVLRPGLVDLSQLPPLPKGVKAIEDQIPPQWKFRHRYETYGVYCADPRIWASEYYGKRGTEAILDGIVKKVREALNDPSFASDRKPITWPADTRQQPEVRYDYQLPYQWMKRFEDTPIVYLPLPTCDSSIATVTNAAINLAQQTSGMVFPPIAYGPRRDGSGICLSHDTYRRVINEVVNDLADMDFRVVALVPSSTLDDSTIQNLEISMVNEGQTKVVTVDPSDESKALAALKSTISTMIPQKPQTRQIDGIWTINGQQQIHALHEGVYGPNTKERIYEHEFEVSKSEAGQAAQLDLGSVLNYCEVIINDADPLKDHWPPYRFIITGLLKAGKNKLKVKVRHQPQESLDERIYYYVGPPKLKGPVSLTFWKVQ
ncbi:MAG: creatininase family protein [Planctomycetota bacterium]|nr:MAG: creatininase family protein [Planctomycetota bacterium]